MPNSTLLDRLGAAYAFFVRMASSLQSPFLLLVRLYWGWQFTQAGWGKLNHLPKVTQFFASLSLPLPAFTAVLVSSMEVAGGILLIVGLASRVTGLLLAFDMFVAYLASDRAALQSVFSDPGTFYNADPYTFLFASLLILIFGPGRFAIDFLLKSRHKAAPRPEPSRAM